ncbi:MAG: extracellular solute-binding protein [Brevefilum sp.]|jgi:maltose-binding protein MalE
MKKVYTKIFVIGLVLILALSACQEKAPAIEEPVVEEPVVEEPVVEEPVVEEPVVEEPAVEAPVATLRIWADDTRTPILQDLAADFLEKYNVEVLVEDLGVVQDIRSQVIIAVPAGEGPDIYIGVHDWLGALTESGLVAPIELGATAEKFVPSTLEAFTFTDGNLYGMPYASENLGLFYNTELVSEPPTTWDEVLEMGRSLQNEGNAKYALMICGDPGYNGYPIWDAFGGYIFGQDESGALNVDDIGLDSEGHIAAVEWVVNAVDEGLMPESTDNETARALFESGELPFLMTGPWDLNRIRDSGVSYAIAPFFPDDGAPLSGVQGFMVNPFSENVLLATTFLTEFVATEETMQLLYETGHRPSAFNSVLATMDDPDLQAMGQAGVNAVPMPNVQEMGSVWSAWNNGITLAITGDLSPEEAMSDAANQVRDLLKGALVGMVNLPGSYQSLAGCGADWDPACAATELIEDDAGLFNLTVELPAGEYEFKIAMHGDWGLNYGSDGAEDGPNYALSLDEDSTVTFIYDPDTHLVEINIE